MVIQNLKSVVSKNRNIGNKDFVRNLLKEELQVFVLNYIYTSATYRNLIFTGGTCLRKFYNLPRISEDLDFDIEGKMFDLTKLQKDIGDYYKKTLQYKNMDSKIKNLTLFLKFPVLREIGFSETSDSDILFLRLDFALNKSSNFGTEKLLFSSYDFSFLARTYDFPTLTANKISAFLTRDYRKGSDQVESFKGRDAFDLVWMLGELNKTGRKINLKRVSDLTNINDEKDLLRSILEKADKISPKDLFNDLRAYFRDSEFVKSFCNNFNNLIKKALDSYLSR